MTVARAVQMLLGLVVVLAFASWGCRGGGGTNATTAEPLPNEDIPAIIAVRLVCRLVADNPQAAAVSITGADGTQSVVVDGRNYFFFGDTVRTGPAGRADVIPAAVATTSDTDASDCIDLQFKATDGVAQPMFPKADETTAWPDGVLALDNGTILFYMVKAYRQSPFAWHVGSVGLGRLPPGAITGTRLTEKIWDDQSGFGSRIAGVRSPILLGDDVIAYLRTDDGHNYAVRAPLARLQLLDAYTYWDGAGWTPDESKAEPLWTDEPSTLPADNGVQVTRDPATGKWLALYNGHLSSLKVRVADEPWGPWSAPVTWLDCRPLVDDVYPYCYTGELHTQFTSAGGATMYATISSQRPYDVALLELQRATPIREWRDGAGALRYAPASPGARYEDRGIAFYGSDRPLPGLAPVYQGAGGAYALEGSGTPAFYAYASPSAGPVHTRPVYRWTRDGIEALSARELDGWTRGTVAFHVPCTSALEENSACGR